MRLKVRVSVFTISIFLLLLSSILIITTFTFAQEDGSLTIFLYDHEDYRGIPMQSPYTFFEGREYGVAVAYGDGEEYAVDVNITTPWGVYIINETNPEIPITEHTYEEYSHFIIRATKEGYISDEVTVSVLKGELTPIVDDRVEENTKFPVLVKDQNNKEIHNATVYLKGYDSEPYFTDIRGLAYPQTPDIESNQEITITAFKEGYVDGSTTIIVEDIIFSLSISLDQLTELLPIFIAVIALISAIIFVTIRKRRSRARLRAETTVYAKHEIHPKAANLDEINMVNAKQPDEEITSVEKEAKVEEIRIIPRKVKETKNMSKEEEERKALPRKSTSKHEYEWHEGTDDVRYKIDKITGEIDEDGEDKWFEGYDDVRSKIDETLNKKDKKKKKEE